MREIAKQAESTAKVLSDIGISYRFRPFLTNLLDKAINIARERL
jgi:hypothetical protein